MNQTATACRAPRGRWTALNIALMVIGFVVFWPLGLAMLAWIIWGDEIGARFEELKGHFRSFSERAPAFAGAPMSHTGNAAFDEYRARELERLAEERRKLDAMRAEFEDFLRELRRVKDQEEFDRFMDSFRNRTDGEDEARA
jgi:hypothetical protein